MDESDEAMVAAPADAGADPLRRLLLALVVVGCVGLGAELLLLEHYESTFQWLPLIVLGAGFVTALAVANRPSRRTVRAFRATMSIAVATGALGIYLHYDGNTEFELEMDPAVEGMGLLWTALHGATPTLAPGALLQLGLLGLIATYRHPLLRRSA